MKLYFKDTGTQITGVSINHVRKRIYPGGNVEVWAHDRNLAAIATIKSYLMQPIEVRRSDGTTVLWEGVLENCRYTKDSANLTGREAFAILADVNCHYNALFAEGVITSLADDYIMDTELTTAATMVGKYVGFMDTDVGGVNEVTYFPNSNTDFFNGGVAPEATSGDYEDLLTGGDTYMYLADTTGKAKDYFGIEVEWTVGNHASAKRLHITLGLMFPPRNVYDATDEPLVELWDEDGSAWVTADNADTAGLGRLDAVSSGWGRLVNQRLNHTITISSNIANYINGDALKVRITCGDTNNSNDRIWLQTATLRSQIYTSYTANTTAYVVDAVDTNKLTFTDQTPNADGVAVKDAYRMGEPLSTIAAGVWLHAPVNLLDLTFTATTLFDAIDLRTQKVGEVLARYAERLSRIIYQAVGWTVECITPLNSTGLSLTEANCVDWYLTVTGENTAGVVASVITKQNFSFYTSNAGVLLMQSFNDADWDMTISDLAEAAGPTRLAVLEVLDVVATIRLDLDDGTDYSAIDIGKTINLNLYSGQLTITAGTIIDLIYMQEGNGHLYADISIQV